MSCVSGDRYRVRVHGVVAPWKLKLMRKGLSVDGIRYKPMIVKVEEKFVSITHGLIYMCRRTHLTSIWVARSVGLL